MKVSVSEVLKGGLGWPEQRPDVQSILSSFCLKQNMKTEMGNV